MKARLEKLGNTHINTKIDMISALRKPVDMLLTLTQSIIRGRITFIK